MRQEFVNLLKEERGDYLLSCFYDMSLNDVSIIAGLGRTSIKTIMKQRHIPEWPFTSLKQGSCTSHTWESIGKHREEVINGMGNIGHRNVLLRAQRRAMVTNTLFNPDYRSKSDPCATEISKGSRVLDAAPAPTPTKRIMMPLPINKVADSELESILTDDIPNIDMSDADKNFCDWILSL